MNKFFTILLIPEKTDQVKKLLIPTIYLRVAMVLGFFACFFLFFMVYDYVKVMQQLAENRKLIVENRELRERIQGFSNKLRVVEDSLERIQTFATKLRIITNQGDDRTESLKEKATRDFPGTPMDDHSVTPGTTQKQIRRAPLSGEDIYAHSDHDENCNHSGMGGPEVPLPLSKEQYLQLARLEPEPRNLGGKIPDLLRPEDEVAKPETTETKTEVSTEPRVSRISELLQSQTEAQLDRRLDDDFSRLDLALNELQRLAESVEIDVQDLGSTLLDQKDYLESMPTLKPTQGWYTSGFGMRLSPYTNQPAMHEGLDIANHYGKYIIAPASGIISFVGVRPGYGQLVTIDHGYGIQTQYGHVSKFFVKEGQRVNRGVKIAAIGSTGRSTGPHVHYEVRVNGIPVDPYFYILND